MTYQDFLRLVMDATEFGDIESYIAETGGSVPATVSDSSLVPLLTRCWEYAHDRGVKAIRQMTGLSMAAFSREYRIPLRTLQNWEASGDNARSCPGYVLDLMAYAVVSEAE